MKTIRRLQAQKNSKRLDDFGEIAINSSMVYGARVIQRFLAHRAENIAKSRNRRTGVF